MIASTTAKVPSEPGVFLRPCLAPKNFHPKVILRHIHGVLIVDEKKLIAQLGEKSRDETFEPN